MPRHRAFGRQRLARGDARIQRVLQQLVLALQLGQSRGAAFGVVHRQPGQRGVAPHRQFGHRQHRALALDARLRAGRTRLALGAVGHLLHQADALHRHEVGRGAEAVGAGHRQVVQADDQPRVGQRGGARQQGLRAVQRCCAAPAAPAPARAPAAWSRRSSVRRWPPTAGTAAARRWRARARVKCPCRFLHRKGKGSANGGSAPQGADASHGHASCAGRAGTGRSVVSPAARRQAVGRTTGARAAG